MSRRRFSIIGLFTATLIAGAPLAHADYYKWTNDDGSTTYSTEPPDDPAAVEDVTKIEQRAEPATPEKPAKFIVETTPPKAANTAVRSAATRSALPRAVQDPCLTSDDRYCYQKHAAHYRPFVGYTPDANPAESMPVVAPARGATAGTGAAGAVGGGTRAK